MRKRSRTLPGQKFKAARMWCEMNDNRIPHKSQWRQMHSETLYAFLETLGVRWSVSKKYWYTVGGASDPVKSRMGERLPSVYQGRLVQVRISAHRSEIDQIVRELTELAEALDWHITDYHRNYENDGGDYVRRYLSIERKRS